MVRNLGLNQQCSEIHRKEQEGSCVRTVDWDSQSLYTGAILENGGLTRGTESKTSKKVSGNWACAFVSNLPNNDSDWSVSKYSVKHDRHAAPHRTTHCTALRESRRTRAWFRSCLFMCTRLELFVYQSSYLSTLAGAVWKSEDCYGISLGELYRVSLRVRCDVII